MGIIAWIVLGLGAGLLANMLIPGRRSQGLLITCVIGICGALLGGWLATKLFHVVTLHGFFNLSTWLTAIAGSAILLVAYHVVTSRGSGRSVRSRRSRPLRRAHRPGGRLSPRSASTRTTGRYEVTGGPACPAREADCSSSGLSWPRRSRPGQPGWPPGYKPRSLTRKQVISCQPESSRASWPSS